MNPPQRKLLLAAAASLLALALALGLPDRALAQAATATTDPVGFTTLTVAAKPASGRGLTYLSLDMARPTLYRGVVPAGGASLVKAGTKLTFPANTFDPSQFTNAATPCYLEFKNGPSAGLSSNIVAATTSSITVADDVIGVINAGSTAFLIRPHWTFSAVFGALNSAGFLGGATVANADTIQLFNTDSSAVRAGFSVDGSGSAKVFFFNTTTNTWWQDVVRYNVGGGSSQGKDATNAIIPPNSGLLIERKTGSPLSFKVVGEVRLGRAGIPVAGSTGTKKEVINGVSLAANPYPLPSVRLADSGLFTGNENTGLAGGASTTDADTASLYDAASGVTTDYYFNTANNRWQDGNGADASNVTVPAGGTLIVTRKAQRPAFIWYAPQPPMNL